MYSLSNQAKKLSVQQIVFILLATIVILGSLLGFFVNKSRSQAPSKEETEARAVVDLVRPSPSQSDQLQGTISATGTVKYAGEISVISQGSGIVTATGAVTGSLVSRNTVLVTLDNRVASLNVTLAEYSRSQAQESLKKAQSGARSEDIESLELAVSSSRTALESATASLRTNLSSTEATLDTIERGLDPYFSQNPTLGLPYNLRLDPGEGAKAARINSNALRQDINTQREALSTARTELDSLLEESTIENDTLASTAEYLNSTLILADELLSDMALVVDNLESDIFTTDLEIAGYQNTVNGLRSLVTASRSTLAQAKASYQANIDGLERAQINLRVATTGARAEDIAILNAQLSAAEASIAQAETALGFNFISPSTSGRLLNLKVDVGDFVSPGQTVATVAGNETFIVETAITASDARSVSVGNFVRISDRSTGTVIEMDRSIDSQSGLVPIKVAIDDQNDFVSGESISLTIISEGSGELLIPISSVLIKGNDTYVLIPNAEGMLEAVAVNLGRIYGDFVIINSGITTENLIVSDVRGRRENEIVDRAETQ